MLSCQRAFCKRTTEWVREWIFRLELSPGLHEKPRGIGSRSSYAQYGVDAVGRVSRFRERRLSNVPARREPRGQSVDPGTYQIVAGNAIVAHNGQQHNTGNTYAAKEAAKRHEDRPPNFLRERSERPSMTFRERYHRWLPRA